MLKQRIEIVEERIQAAVARAGRRRDEVTLVAISKRFPAESILEAYELGLRHFGENYVQEFELKAPSLGGLTEARFHFVGHLQSNKTRRASELFHVIETVDSEKIARRISEPGRIIDVMLEVKLSPEQAKSGAAPEQLAALVDAVRACAGVRLTGLMTMPPWGEDPEASRPYFRRLRELAKHHNLPCLSMGMSQDFEIAIQEGATHVRIGTAIFGERSYA